MTLAGFRQEKAIGAEYATSQLYAQPLTHGTRRALGWRLSRISDCYGTMACLKCDWQPPPECEGDCFDCRLDCMCRKGGE